MKQHEEAARLRAQEGERYRATQKAPDAQLDDGDVDELFRQTVLGKSGTPTPKKTRPNTPSSAGSTGHRTEKLQRFRVEQAGFGDLSDIMEMSSFTLSSPCSNPYADPQTPTKGKASQFSTPTSRTRGDGESQTPTSLVRNIFARSRGSPMETPTKRTPRHDVSPTKTPSKSVVLSQPRRSITKWSLSPILSSPPGKLPSSSPVARSEDKAVPLEIHAKSVGKDPPIPNAQRIPATPLPQGTRRLADATPMMSATVTDLPHASSATLRPSQRPGLSNSSDHRHSSPTPRSSPLPPAEFNARPKKRVRLSSPSQRRPTQPTTASAESGTSAADPSGGTDGTSGSDLPVNGWTWSERPPSKRDVMDTMEEFGQDMVEYHEPFYSDPADVPPRPKLFAGRSFKVKTNAVAGLLDFEHDVLVSTTKSWLKTRHSGTVRSSFGWEYGPPPPSRRDVVRFCQKEDAVCEFVLEYS